MGLEKHQTLLAILYNHICVQISANDLGMPQLGAGSDSTFELKQITEIFSRKHYSQQQATTRFICISPRRCEQHEIVGQCTHMELTIIIHIDKNCLKEAIIHIDPTLIQLIQIESFGPVMPASIIFIIKSLEPQKCCKASFSLKQKLTKKKIQQHSLQ